MQVGLCFIFWSLSIALVHLCSRTSAQSIRLSDLHDLGVQYCPHKNSCPSIGNATFSERICECDSRCRNFGDCCLDAAGPSTRRPTNSQICMGFGNATHQGVYVIGCCPPGYDGPPEIRTQCLQGNLSDPLLSAPVTDTSSGKTYLNHYCALCNDASSLKTWVVSACEVPNTDLGSVSWEDLTYRSRLGKWGVTRNGEFQACEFMYDKPSSVTRGLRWCRANLVSSCSREFRRANYRRNCDAYMSVVTDGTTLYRNPHCALCNGVQGSDLSCFSPQLFQRSKARPFSFALLLDVNRSDGDRVGMSRQSCPDGQKYDPFFKKCRNLVCAIPGHTIVNGKCARI